MCVAACDADLCAVGACEDDERDEPPSDSLSRRGLLNKEPAEFELICEVSYDPDLSSSSGRALLLDIGSV